MISCDDIKTSRSEDDGFTLVEVLVALALVCLLSVLTLNSLQFGIEVWRRSSESSTKLDDRIHAESFLRQLLSHASPRFVTRVGATGYVEFEGQETSLRLIADPPQSLSGSGPLIFTLQTENSDSHRSLSISSRPELAKADAQSSLDRRVLLQDVGEVEFAYFGSKGAPAAWHREWLRETHLPDLIRITLRKDAGEGETSLLIRPRIDVDVSCIYDALSRRCRGR
jgi:general secretion pathway protein J